MHFVSRSDDDEWTLFSLDVTLQQAAAYGTRTALIGGPTRKTRTHKTLRHAHEFKELNSKMQFLGSDFVSDTPVEHEDTQPDGTPQQKQRKLKAQLQDVISRHIRSLNTIDERLQYGYTTAEQDADETEIEECEEEDRRKLRKGRAVLHRFLRLPRYFICEHNATMYATPAHVSRISSASGVGISKIFAGTTIRATCRPQPRTFNCLIRGTWGMFRVWISQC